MMNYALKIELFFVFLQRKVKNIMNNMGVKVRLLGAMTLAVILTACGGSSDNSEKAQVKYETQVMRPEARICTMRWEDSKR